MKREYQYVTVANQKDHLRTLLDLLDAGWVILHSNGTADYVHYVLVKTYIDASS